MNNQILTLSYLNEDDRAYGLAGMAISLAVSDALENVSNIDIDADGPMVTFSHSYYYSGSPSISPKTTWHNILRNFQITTSMVIGNVMARSLVRLNTPVPEDIITDIRAEVHQEGIESCALEDDEVDTLFNNALIHSQRIFRNPRLHPVIREFANFISRRRNLSGLELIDEMHRLQIL